MDRHHAFLVSQTRINAATGAVGVPSLTGVQQNGSSYKPISSYNLYNTSQLTMQNLCRLVSNAPDDLNSVPNTK